MKQNGLPTGEAEIRSSRVQTNWLLGLALLVAFVGILNAMLMSVTERFREIGTMKCLGALDGFIIKLFLIESLFQGIVGTVLGILIGLGLSFAAAAASYGGYAWINLPVSELITGVAICLLIGIGLTVAGALYPASSTNGADRGDEIGDVTQKAVGRMKPTQFAFCFCHLRTAYCLLPTGSNP